MTTTSERIYKAFMSADNAEADRAILAAYEAKQAASREALRIATEKAKAFRAKRDDSAGKGLTGAKMAKPTPGKAKGKKGKKGDVRPFTTYHGSKIYQANDSKRGFAILTRSPKVYGALANGCDVKIKGQTLRASYVCELDGVLHWTVGEGWNLYRAEQADKADKASKKAAEQARRKLKTAEAKAKAQRKKLKTKARAMGRKALQLAKAKAHRDNAQARLAELTETAETAENAWIEACELAERTGRDDCAGAAAAWAAAAAAEKKAIKAADKAQGKAAQRLRRMLADRSAKVGTVKAQLVELRSALTALRS